MLTIVQESVHKAVISCYAEEQDRRSLDSDKFVISYGSPGMYQVHVLKTVTMVTHALWYC